MRRILSGAIAFLALLGTILVLPVYAAPVPEPEPIEVDAEQVTMGSLDEPAAAVEVQEGTTEPVEGVSETAPTLTVTRTDVDGFSMVNVNWAYDPAVTDTVVQVRVQDAAGQWGEWTEVETEDAEPEADGGAAEDRRGSTAPLWTGASTGVEVELVTRSGAAPTDVQVDLIDPGTSAADTSLGTPDIQDTADAAMAMPDVYSRAQWGADENLRTWAPEYAPTLKAATLHHTASSSNYTAADVPAILRGIYYSHAVSNRWGDIGYNVLVDKFGRLWEGRAGGLSRTTIGAHAGGFNTGTFGVSMLGNYDVTDTTQPMVDAVSAIIAWKFSLYGIDPRGSTSLVSGGGGTSRYAAGVRVTVPTIFGHRDVGATACPGRYGYSRMDEIRSSAARQISGALSGIETYYQSNAAARSSLGTAVGAERPVGDGVGWVQDYQHGAIYWSPATGAHALFGGIRHRWNLSGGTAGSLGYPAGDMRCGLPGDGCAQDFAGGSIYWSPTTDSRLLFGGIRGAWLTAGGPLSPVGYPTSDMTCGLPGGGCSQSFQYGAYYWSADTGARSTSGAVLGFWNARGGPQGLGYPVIDLTCGLPGGGCGQDFQRASVYWSEAGGAQQVEGGVRAGWLNAGGPGGPLGYPVAGLVCGLAGDGCRQPYERGWVYWSPSTGAQATRGDVQAAWLARGGHGGSLGYPAAALACGTADQGCWQQFQNGVLAWQTTAGAHPVPGELGRYWLTTGGGAGPLGPPDADAVCAPGGASCTQEFRDGTAVWSSTTGAHAVRGGILPAWEAAGADGGALGRPTGETSCGLVAGGCTQTFEGGLLAWSPATGAWATGGAVAGFWGALQGPSGVLGYPTTAMSCGLPGGGCRQEFQGGSVLWSPVAGTQFVSGAIAQFWSQVGGPGGGLGYPVSGMVCGLAADGCRQEFQGGPVYWSPASGSSTVSGAIQGLWNAYGAERGGLGYPVSPMACGLVGGGCRQLFQGGLLVWSPGGGTHVTGGAIDGAWAERGRQDGVLGYPTSAMVCGLVRGGCGQQFQGGSLHWSPATGAQATHGAIRDAWAAQGWETGSLGYPTGAMTCAVSGDCEQRFQGGTLRWIAAQGRVQRTA